MAENLCLNCGVKLQPGDRFCNNCGQKNRSSRITVKELFSEFLSDYFTFDSKFFRSITPLLFKPGFLTNEYIEGKRSRYIPPLRMYLFISIIYFFVISLNADSIVPQPEITANEEDNTGTFISFGGERVYLSSIEEAYNSGNETSLLDSLGMEKSSLNITMAKLFTKQYIKLSRHPAGFAPQVLKTASIMMFLILPVFALLLKLFYVRRSYYYLDHLIFSFHFHSFLFLLLLILYFTIDIIPGLSITLISLIVLFYLYKSLKNVYGQKRSKTLLKMSALLFSGFIILLAGFLTTMLVSFLLF